MPITYSIDGPANVITLHLSGMVSSDDISGYLEASRGDPDYRPTLHRLVIVDAKASFPASPAVRQITAQTNRGSPDPTIRIAAVATTPMGRGMVAMFFGLWGIGDQYHLFDDEKAARQWLVAASQG